VVPGPGPGAGAGEAVVTGTVNSVVGGNRVVTGTVNNVVGGNRVVTGTVNSVVGGNCVVTGTVNSVVDGKTVVEVPGAVCARARRPPATRFATGAATAMRDKAMISGLRRGVAGTGFLNSSDMVCPGR